MNTMLFLAQAAADNAAGNAAGVFFGLGTVALIVFIVLSIFWLWMLIDALTNTALDSTMKIIWALVIFFGHILGALIYFFVGRKARPTTVV